MNALSVVTIFGEMRRLSGCAEGEGKHCHPAQSLRSSGFPLVEHFICVVPVFKLLFPYADAFRAPRQAERGLLLRTGDGREITAEKCNNLMIAEQTAPLAHRSGLRSLISHVFFGRKLRTQGACVWRWESCLTPQFASFFVDPPPFLFCANC